MIVCNRCGKENQDHYKFCLGCGAELTAAGKAGGDVAMLKTMMSDSPAPLPGMSPGRPLPGVGGPAPTPGMPPVQGFPGGPLPPPGPLGGLAAGPLGGGPIGGPRPAGPPPGLGGPPPGLGGPPPGLGGPPPGPPAAPPPLPPMGPPPALRQGPPSAGSPAGPPPGVPGGGPAPGFSSPPQQAAPQVAGPRRCPQCGADVPPGFRFCGACGCRMDEASQPAMAARVATPVAAPRPAPQPRAMLTLIRPDGSEGGTHELRQGENKIGRNFASLFESDGYLSPIHADLLVAGDNATVRDLDSLNGVFVKMTDEEEITAGQILRIGQELLRFEWIDPQPPVPDGTEVMGSPNPGYWGKVTVILGKDIDGSAFPLLGDTVTLGRERGEINFPEDGYVSGLHARISLREGRVYLADLGSSNGTFLKVHGERPLINESFVLMGQQLFRVNLSA